jgi:hypothetical protein
MKLKTEKDYHYIRTQLRWTKKEYKELEAKAKELGLKDVSDYLKFLVSEDLRRSSKA